MRRVPEEGWKWEMEGGMDKNWREYSTVTMLRTQCSYVTAVHEWLKGDRWSKNKGETELETVMAETGTAPPGALSKDLLGPARIYMSPRLVGGGQREWMTLLVTPFFSI